MNTRNASVQDLTQIASIHKLMFKDHYLGQFSINLIARFYKTYLNAETIFLVSYNEEEVVTGFVLGGKNTILDKCASDFEKNNLLSSALEILFRPVVWYNSFKRVVRLIINKLHIKSNSSPNQSKKTRVNLLSKAVHKDYQGKGVAKELVATFNDIIKKQTNEYFLSVHSNNERAIRFYENLGFTKDMDCGDSIKMKKELK